MYTVDYIYLIDARKVTLYARDKITPVGLMDLMTVNTQVLISCVDEYVNEHVVDFTLLQQDYPSVSYTTWDEVDDFLTDEYIDGYKAYLPGYAAGSNKLKTSLVAWDPLNVYNTFNLDYADHETGKSNISVLRYKLKDIKISLQSELPATYPDLSHCVPVVNGFVCRPSYDKINNYLYGVGGSELCWNGKIPEVQLLDFSDLGDILVQNLVITKDALANTTIITNSRLNLTSTWHFNTPLDLSAYTPIVVLAGIPILPDMLRIKNKHNFTLFPATYNFARVLAYRAYCQDEYGTHAELDYPAVSDPLTYFSNTLTEGNKSGDCFVLYVRTANLYVSRVRLTTWRRGLTIDLYSDNGLLIRDNTQTVHTYHASAYVDRKQLDLQPIDELYFTEYEKDLKQSLIYKTDCQHLKNKLASDSSFSMVYLFK